MIKILLSSCLNLMNPHLVPRGHPKRVPILIFSDITHKAFKSRDDFPSRAPSHPLTPNPPPIDICLVYQTLSCQYYVYWHAAYECSMFGLTQDYIVLIQEGLPRQTFTPSLWHINSRQSGPRLNPLMNCKLLTEIPSSGSKLEGHSWKGQKSEEQLERWIELVGIQ